MSQFENNKNINESDFSRSFPKLRAAILYFVNKIPEKLNRISLCKHLYYADGHFFQKYSKMITENDYLHIEGSPQPFLFNEILYSMVNRKEIEIIPNLKKERGPTGTMNILKGLIYKAHADIPEIFSREELKVFNSVAAMFKGDLSLETRYYPNLYQQYAQTGLYEIINMLPLPDDGKRPHLSWKGWANKIFNLKWQ